MIFDIEKEKKKLDRLHQRVIINCNEIKTLYQKMRDNCQSIRTNLKHTKQLLDNFSLSIK